MNDQRLHHSCIESQVNKDSGYRCYLLALPKEAIIVIDPTTKELCCDRFVSVWKLKFIQYA